MFIVLFYLAYKKYISCVQWMVGGGRGKPGETIRPAARRVEPEQRSDTESGTVTIHHRPTEGPNVRAKTERVMTAFVTFMDVPVRFLFCILDKCKISESLFGHRINVTGYIS